MNDDHDDAPRSTAAVDAAQARAQLTATLVDVQARLHPRALLRDAVAELRETGVEIAQGALAAARKNPGPLIGIGATLVAIFARDWLVDAFAKHDDAATTSPAPRSAAIDDGDGVVAPREGKTDD
ncbi:MAG: hypothetical protein BVN32_05385 [Proteobacteria bacterium ST_bin14]|nr:MAG: hypothetical protein BVN32_05385 [Proteobacteria bacterium ST_bin14]